MKLALKIIGIICIVILLFGIIFLGTLTILDYQPKETEVIEVEQRAFEPSLKDISVLTWNIGYSGLGAKEDFFLDGGEKVFAPKEHVEEYLKGIRQTLADMDLDYILLQEVDIQSKRSYKINEYEAITEEFPERSSSFAYNYKVPFVPFPWPPLGLVQSGLAFYSSSQIESSLRIGFEENYKWPVKTAHLDRCLLINTIDVKGSDKALVLINAHLSAYDDGGLRKAQLKKLKKIMLEEYNKGNYVVIGGDFNQTFSVIHPDHFKPLYPEIFVPQVIDSTWLPEGWSWGVDDSVPTYRLLNKTYRDPKINQTGIIDGFIVSPNVELLDMENIDLQFAYSDHNPVRIDIRLK